ncbi:MULTISPECIES: universal stress protein [unclassified Haladaptatus]|uniref:universal stress protein n=1 Tax=unclassified Haladaptatus TaxID=2622732 RepID=UPI0023E7832A|nr:MULTISPECIES: universal stress protein [unclassified Haladaptatus]
MGKRLLVPMDGSEQAAHALRFGLKEFPSSDITVLYVINPIDTGFSPQASLPGYAEEWYKRAEGIAEDIFLEADDVAAEYDRGVDTETVVGRPAHEIVDFAVDNEFDQIVMGSHGRTGVSRILLGSVAESVVRRSPLPVTIVR